MPREIITDWITPAGGGFVTVMFFDPSDPVATQREAIGDLWRDVDGALNSGVRWTVRTAGREMDDTTGTLTGVWSEATGQTALGASTVDPIPDATQVLLRWETGFVVNGRMLKGRSFVPGLIVNGTDGGNVEAATLANYTTYANNFIAADVQFGIWHRPVQSAGGNFVLATTGSCWSELAVLRRRRH